MHFICKCASKPYRSVILFLLPGSTANAFNVLCNLQAKYDLKSCKTTWELLFLLIYLFLPHEPLIGKVLHLNAHFSQQSKACSTKNQMVEILMFVNGPTA